MDILLIILGISLFLLIYVIATSNGECYYCGYRFHRDESLMFRDDKKWCGCNKGYEEIIKHQVKRSESTRKVLTEGGMRSSGGTKR